MKNREILERCDDALLRVDECIFIAAAVTDGTITERLSEFFENEEVEKLEELLGVFDRDLSRAIESGRRRDIADFAGTYLCDAGKLGFLLNVTTPVFKKIADGHTQFTWGYCNTKWFYGDTFESALEQALGWAEALRAKAEA